MSEANGETKQSKKKGSPLGCLVVIVVLALIGWALGSGSEDQSPQTASSGSEQQISWTTADVTPDSIKAALGQKTEASPTFSDGDFPKDITNVEVINHGVKSGQKNICIYFKPDTVWDETDFVKKVGGTAIQVGSILYTNPKVEDVTLFAESEMTDQYGKTQTEVVTKISLTREFAEKVDWVGLADRHTTDPGNIYRIVDYYIHPGILKNVKLDEVQLQ